MSLARFVFDFREVVGDAFPVDVVVRDLLAFSQSGEPPIAIRQGTKGRGKRELRDLKAPLNDAWSS
jgi:hypothetical protein